MTINFKEFGVWLHGASTPEEKLAACTSIIATSREGSYYSLETLGKAGCHLAYRLIDGHIKDSAEVFADVEWARHVCMGAVSEKPVYRTRWTGSLTIALIYLHLIVAKNREAAAELCRQMIDYDAVEAHPQNMLNIQRACNLLAVYESLSDNLLAAHAALRDCRRIYKLGINSFTFDGQPMIVGDELQWSSNMVKLSVGLGPKCGVPTRGKTHEWWSLALVEQAEPFRTAFVAMCGTILEPPVVDLNEHPPQTREDLARLFVGEGIELGVASGWFSGVILKNGKPTKLHSIDCWNSHHDLKECRAASERLIRLGNGACIPIRCTAEEALGLFDDNSQDFIFMDLYAHEGQGGADVIAAWFRKVKFGGIISGHDFCPEKWPDNVAAVESFAAAHNLTIKTTFEKSDKPGIYRSWYAVKSV